MNEATSPPLRKPIFRVTIEAHVPDRGQFRVEGGGFYRNAREFVTEIEADTPSLALSLGVALFHDTYPGFRPSGNYHAHEVGL